MFIRYYLIYYALSLFLLVLSFFYPLLFILFIIYSLIFIIKTGFINVVVFYLLIFLCLTFMPRFDTTFYSEIKGRVTEVKSNYCVVHTKNQNIKVYLEGEVNYGDEVRMELSELEINPQSNDNGFDEELYLKSHHIQIKARCKKLEIIKSTPTLMRFIESRLSDEEKIRSYQRLFILGIKDEYIENDYNQLLNLSIVHLFALSGMHLAFLNKMLNTLFFFLNKNIKRIVIYSLLLVYLLSIPYSISLWRAYLMMAGYDVTKKYFNQLDVFALVFMGFVLYNPYVIYNYSFMFSFGIYFMVLITQNVPHQSIYVYLLSLPFLIYSQNQIYLFSLFFTYFLTPFIEYFYQLIILSLIFSIVNVPLHYLVISLSQIIQLASLFDAYLIFRTPTLSFIVLYYIIAFTIIYKSELGLKCIRQHSLLLALLMAFYFYGACPLYASVTMIDVGQGDSCLIRLPFFQGSLLIDTGGNYNYDLATNTLIPYFKSIGLSKLDYVYISHDDYDHCGALDSLKENFRIDHIIRDYEPMRQIGDLTVEMLTTDKLYTNENDKSLLMKLTLYDYHLLFMGDASREVEEDLLEKYGHLDIDILKVSHHGSKTSTGTALFRLIEPRIAMISVKKNNMYHHPAPEVIDRLNKKGIMILRTDEVGMFHLRFYPSSYYIFT